MTENVILIVCGILFVLLLGVLIWWLKVGKQHFIEKRCPERLEKYDGMTFWEYNEMLRKWLEEHYDEVAHDKELHDAHRKGIMAQFRYYMVLTVVYGVLGVFYAFVPDKSIFMTITTICFFVCAVIYGLIALNMYIEAQKERYYDITTGIDKIPISVIRRLYIANIVNKTAVKNNGKEQE